jgi:regulator of nonsense transcripts 2
MDVDFIIQDTYSLVRPQWKIATDLEEATRLFGEAISQNYSMQDSDKAIELEEEDSESVSSDGNADDGLEEENVLDGDEEPSSTEEAEVRVPFLAGESFLKLTHHTVNQQVSGANAEHEDDSASEEDDDDEQIFVARPDEERDPEADAEFDRAFEKMLAESLESRRFDRKPIFDVPLPMRPSRREGNNNTEEAGSEPQAPATMAFSLMTKKGNKQQVVESTIILISVGLHCD